MFRASTSACLLLPAYQFREIISFSAVTASMPPRGHPIFGNRNLLPILSPVRRNDSFSNVYNIQHGFRFDREIRDPRSAASEVEFLQPSLRL